MSDSVRAVRNNNPGNIEKGQPWQGLMAQEQMNEEQRAETRFCVFRAPKWGFRAMAVTLITYYDKRKAADGSRIDTIAEAIERWAPPVENATGAYISAVDRAHPRQAHEVFNFHDYDDLAPLVKAIATHECGGWFFEDSDLDEGLKLAGVIKPVPAAAVATNRTVKAATAAGALGGVEIAAQLAQQVAPATSLIKEVSSYAPWAAGVLVILIMGVIIYYHYDDWRRQQ